MIQYSPIYSIIQAKEILSYESKKSNILQFVLQSKRKNFTLKGPKVTRHLQCTQFRRSILPKVNNINTLLCIITTGSVLFLLASPA